MENYSALLLSSLLHDIGKFYQRATDFSKTHSKYSGDFIDDYKDSFENSDLIKTLVTHHHEQQKHEDENPERIEDINIRNLAWLIDKSDNISSGERNRDEILSNRDTNSDQKKRFQLISSIFNSVYIGEEFKSDKRYKFGNFDTFFSEGYENLFPKDNLINEKEDYTNYWNEFTEEFEKLFSGRKVNLDSLYSLIQKYCWCIPSDTTTDKPDISLADHLKTTCAISACAFKYHEETDWEESRVKNTETEKYCLVAGDISGIQNFIYSVASLDTKGLSKRLRGRSFKIAALSEIISLDILQSLDLPNMCKLMSAGGMFYLLIPNTEKAINILTAKIIEFQNKLLDEFNGELSVSIAHIPLNDEGFKKECFGEKLQEVKDKLNERKLQKFSSILSQGPKLFNMNYKGHGTCSVCDTNPGVIPFGDGFVCRSCEEEEALGDKLANNYKWENDDLKTNNNYFIISREKGEFKLLDYFIDIVPKDEVKDYNPIIAFNMTDYDIIEDCPVSFFPYAGYIPVWKDEEELMKALGNDEKLLETEKLEGDFEAGSVPKSFSAIACSGEGHDLLGVLRADVDNLGLIFSQGLGKDASISRISTLSSMLNLFFTRVVTDIILTGKYKYKDDDKENEENNYRDYKNVYISYCGGDDLMLMGYFDDIINLANEIRLKLSKFVCGNPNITISVGIGTYKAKTPVAITSRQTGDLLELSKIKKYSYNLKNGQKVTGTKNSLTLFDTTIPWAYYSMLSKWCNDFYSALNDKSGKFSISFLYRLLVYQKMSRSEDLLYEAKLSYDIARNFKDNKGEYIVNKDIQKILDSLLVENVNKKIYWKNLKLPITWAAYKNRK